MSKLKCRSVKTQQYIQ